MSFKSLKNNCTNRYYHNAYDFSKTLVDICSTSKRLNILQFNIRSMNDLCKFDSFLHFIDGLHSDIHLIVISETWVQSSNKYSFNISNYSSVFSCRDDRVGAGIAMYVRNDLSYKIIDIDDGTLQFQYICIQLLGFNSTNICGIYRPPSCLCSDVDSFLEFLENFLRTKKGTSDLVIVGDINIPVNKNSNVVSEYQSALLSHGMIVTNTYTTRPSSGNILDHIISSFLNIDRVLNSTIESDISDHSFVFSTLILKSRYVNRELLKKIINYKKVNLHFDNFLLSTSFDISDPNATFDRIFKKYNELVNRFSELKRMTAKIKNSSNCPWMKFDLWELIKEKNLTLKRLKHNINNPDLKTRLEVLNKKIKSGKYFAKKQYFENLINNLNQKEVWKQINLFMKSNTNSNIQSIIFNDIEYNDPQTIVNILNRSFVNVGNTSTNIGNLNSNINHFHTLTSRPNTCFLSPTSATEVFNIICSLDNSKGVGYDNIRSIVLKRNSNFFSNLLADLFNVVLETGIYPDCLKIAKVSPIFKTGNRKSVENYRPISVLSVFDKIFEKLIASRITEFLNESNFLYTYQYGFRKGSGCDRALVEITDMIYHAFDNQRYVCGLFLDLRKAFDCIDHDLLLYKLHCYGFRGAAYNLLKSYLVNRRQFVTIDGIKSETLKINSGVPQGSVLGPLLFLIFINDISRLPLVGRVRMFADDTAIFYESKDCTQTMVDMKSDLNILLEFFNINKMSINFIKTKYIVFHSPFLSHCDLPLLQISNVTIERVDRFKYLGVTFDKHMFWDEHIHILCLKVSPFIFLIRKLASFVPTHILKLIYFSFIHTRFTYAIIAFGTAAKTKLKKLQVLQNKCCKAIYKLPHLFPSVEIYRDIARGILPINGLFVFNILLYMYKCLNVSATLSNIEYEFVNHRYPTRSSNLLKCHSICTEFGRKSISYIGPFTFNNLPDTLKSSENIFIFKKKLKQYLLSLTDDYL